MQQEISCNIQHEQACGNIQNLAGTLLFRRTGPMRAPCAAAVNTISNIVQSPSHCKNHGRGNNHRDFIVMHRFMQEMQAGGHNCNKTQAGHKAHNAEDHRQATTKYVADFRCHTHPVYKTLSPLHDLLLNLLIFYGN